MHPHPILAAFGIGGTELMVILAIALLFFGGGKLPQLAKGLGQSIKEFKKASTHDEDETAPAPSAQPSAGEVKPSAIQK